MFWKIKIPETSSGEVSGTRSSVIKTLFLVTLHCTSLFLVNLSIFYKLGISVTAYCKLFPTIYTPDCYQSVTRSAETNITESLSTFYMYHRIILEDNRDYGNTDIQPTVSLVTNETPLLRISVACAAQSTC